MIKCFGAGGERMNIHSSQLRKAVSLAVSPHEKPPRGEEPRGGFSYRSGAPHVEGTPCTAP
jgi:hypothetical protein